MLEIFKSPEDLPLRHYSKKKKKTETGGSSQAIVKGFKGPIKRVGE